MARAPDRARAPIPSGPGTAQPSSIESTVVSITVEVTDGEGLSGSATIIIEFTNIFDGGFEGGS